MRAALVCLAVALGGCSLIFDGSVYEHDDAATPMDGGADAGTDGGGCDGTQECCDWMDCEVSEDTPYCVHDPAGGTWSCEAECRTDADCVGFFAGEACLDDEGIRICGCQTDADCTFPGLTLCDQPRFPDCVECRGDSDCTGGRTCSEGFCE